MSEEDDKKPLRKPGRRKDGKPYKDGNTGDDGGYEVGKNRPPAAGQFRKGDGRKRGRRAKAVRNADTDFEKELARPVTVTEDGQPRKVSKSHAVDLRLLENALRKGQNKAIEMIDHRRQRIAVASEETARRYHTLSDHMILEQYLQERAAELNIDPRLFGDPEPQGEGSDG